MRNMRIILIFYLSICIAIAFSEKTFDYKFLSNKVVNYLEALSLPIYLNHSWIISYGKQLMPAQNAINSNYYCYLIIILAVSFGISAIEMGIINLIKNKGIISKIKNKLVKE